MHFLFKEGEMLLVRPVIASSVNHVRAVFSPQATLLHTLYATVRLQHEVPCEQRRAGYFEYPLWQWRRRPSQHPGKWRQDAARLLEAHPIVMAMAPTPVPTSRKVAPGRCKAS